MVDASKSFEVSENGFTFDLGIWVGSGAAVPTHNAPQGSVYFRTDSTRYTQNGPGETNNWVVDATTMGATYSHLFQTNQSGVTIDIVTQDVWVKWDNSTLGPEMGDVTGSTATDDITVNAGGAGDYEVQYSATIQAPTNNNIQGSIHLNDAVVSRTISEVDIDNTSSIYTVNFSCLMTLAADDVVDLRFRNTSGTPDITVFNVCMYITKLIGGSKGETGAQGPIGETNVDGGDANTTIPAIDIDGGSA